MYKGDLGSRFSAFPTRTMDDYLPELILLCGAGAILALNFFTTPREEATRLEDDLAEQQRRSLHYPNVATSIPNRSSSQPVEAAKNHATGRIPFSNRGPASATTHSLDRFKHLTEVNTPPNHAKAPSFILAQARQTVKSIEQRVDQVTLVLNSAKKITHPLRSVPNEILCLIFAHTVDFILCLQQVAPARPFFPFPLDKAVFRLHDIWNNWPSSPANGVSDDSVINDWIGHYALRHIIQATTARWKSAVLDLPLSEILLFKGCTFPLLESVKIQSRHPAIANEQDVDVFLSMPLLRSITITSESSLALYSALMPWSQIVEYNCEHHAFSTENLDVLRQMTSLRSLVAYVLAGFSLEVVEPIVLPALTHLELSVTGASRPVEINLSGYLAFLRMPLLSHFALNYCEPDALCPLSSHPDFPSVKSLGVHLDLASSNSEDFVHFLSFMNGVEELELSGAIICDKLLEVLTPSEDGMLVLPHLRVLDTVVFRP
ncbi:hypothetical protein BDZ89DRAFT_1159290 [Hymenopellis radicata]|nr:hypothetical protein BDZ89DRAFT_1159290 [Hymenopellis radicata]